MDHISRPTQDMASVRRMPKLPRQGMGCGCAARPRSLQGAGTASLSNLRRKRTGIPVKNFRRKRYRSAVDGLNDKIRPTRSKEDFDDPEGEDRNPQSCRTPRWTEVRRKRLSRVVRRSTSQLCRMPVWLASRPRGPLSGPHSLRATRIVPLWTSGRGDLAVPAVLFPQQFGRFVLASIRARRIAMIESPIAAASLALRPATFLGGHVNANHRARR
jgi:hypothetical protein